MEYPLGAEIIGTTSAPVHQQARKTIKLDFLGRTLQFLFCTIFIVGLLLALEFVIAPRWAYMGFGFSLPSETWYGWFSLVVAVFPSLLMPVRISRPSALVNWCLYLAVYIPSQLVPVFASNRTWMGYGRMQLLLTIAMLLLIVASSVPAVRIPSLQIPHWIFWSSVVALALLIDAFAISSFGVPTSLPRLSDVYAQRAEFARRSSDLGFAMTYLLDWQIRVVNPLLIASGIVRRNLFTFALGLGGQFLIFGLSGHKFALFSALLVIGILLAIASWRRIGGIVFSLGAAAIVPAAVLGDRVLGTETVSSLFVRRLLLFPGVLTGYYHEFFSFNPITRSLGPLSGVTGGYDYGMPVPNLIGLTYFGSEKIYANGNVWADSYASFGYLGVVAFTALVAIVLWVFDCCARSREQKLSLAIAGIAGFALVNSGLFVSLGTHGIAFALILLILYPPDRTFRRGGSRRTRNTTECADAAS